MTQPPNAVRRGGIICLESPQLDRARRQARTAVAELHHAAITGFGWMMPFIPLIDQN